LPFKLRILHNRYGSQSVIFKVHTVVQFRVAPWSTLLWTWLVTARTLLTGFRYGADLQRVFGHWLASEELGSKDGLANSATCSYDCGDGRPNGYAKMSQQHLSTIDALDLAVDRRIATTVGPQLRPLRENSIIFRSEHSLARVYGPVKSAPPAAAEIQPNPARSDRRRSLWKRSKRFMWKSMVNTASRVCFCQSFVDLEWYPQSSTSSPATVIPPMLPVTGGQPVFGL